MRWTAVTGVLVLLGLVLTGCAVWLIAQGSGFGWLLLAADVVLGFVNVRAHRRRGTRTTTDR